MESHPRAGEDPRTPPVPYLAPPVVMGARLREHDSGGGQARTLSFPARRASGAGREPRKPPPLHQRSLGPLPLRRLSPPPAGDDKGGGLDKIVLVCLYSSRPARRGARS